VPGFPARLEPLMYTACVLRGVLRFSINFFISNNLFYIKKKKTMDFDYKEDNSENLTKIESITYRNHSFLTSA
jgi:hypothetical protein